MQSHDLDFAEIGSGLTGWLRERMPQAEGLTVSNLEASGAGFNNVSLLFDLTWKENGQPQGQGMLFRGAGRGEPVYPDPKLERQFRVMQCLRSTDVPVPQVYWMEKDTGLLGFPFYVMSKIEGTVPSEFPPYHSFGICLEASPAQRARMWWNLLEEMVKIHELDWRRLGLSFLGVPPPGTGPLDQELEYYRRYLEWTREGPQPVLEATLAWLRENRYAPERVTLCWGDARLPNTMFDPEGKVAGVLDWDMAILGDPESDLAFLIALDDLLSEGIGIPRLEGFPGREETVARYQELTGWTVQHLFYNEVFAHLRAGIVILTVQKQLLRKGIGVPGENPLQDTPSTRRLASLLDLPSPSTATATAEEIRPREALAGTVQVHLTGPGGGSWVVVTEGGETTRHPGEVEQPDATLTVKAEDWAAIQRGEMNPFNAWTSGRLQISGDDVLFRQLADTISRLWRQAPGGGEER